MKSTAPGLVPTTQAAIDSMQASSSAKQLRKPQPQPLPLSPSRQTYSQAMAASPSHLRSSSPRLQSPASSEIFERNVQEPVPISTLQGELDQAHIATHVITEDHIPPALEASVEAITSGVPSDDVEIVTATAHQPASASAASVLEGSTGHADSYPGFPGVLQHRSSEQSESASHLHRPSGPFGSEDQTTSNYAQLDPHDVRRLSFISFKDIVEGEHQQAASSHLNEIGSRENLHAGHYPSNALQERASSPLRSPRSPVSHQSQSLSSGIATPPSAPPGVNIDSSAANVEQSPVRSLSNQHGELNIETLGQALRKTASRDLSGIRGTMSPISDETSLPRSRTNT